MASTAPAYRESGRQNSEKARAFFSQEKLASLISSLPIKPNLRSSFAAWWRICTSPAGTEIQLFKELKAHAREAQISERTARYHRRAFENLQLVEVAHPANSKFRRPTTHRLKIETLVKRPWTTCPSCGHRHQRAEECGCLVKYGKSERTCRCAPRHAAPVPIRPSRSSHSSPSPAQERAASPTSLPPATAAPVPAAAVQQRETSRPPRRLTSREGPQLVAKVAELMRGYHGTVNTVSGLVHVDESHPKYRAPMSQEHALTAACMTLGIPYEAAMEHLKLCRWKFDEPESSA